MLKVAKMAEMANISLTDLLVHVQLAENLSCIQQVLVLVDPVTS
jgi:hypothetical protein